MSGERLSSEELDALRALSRRGADAVLTAGGLAACLRLASAGLVAGVDGRVRLTQEGSQALLADDVARALVDLDREARRAGSADVDLAGVLARAQELLSTVAALAGLRR